jgi:hypothetical protein
MKTSHIIGLVAGALALSVGGLYIYSRATASAPPPKGQSRTPTQQTNGAIGQGGTTSADARNYLAAAKDGVEVLKGLGSLLGGLTLGDDTDEESGDGE